MTKGRVVKGTSFTELRDAGDPVELAAFYYREGADELVFLDITATHEERGIIRITSYNVCYTKLLRTISSLKAPEAVAS